jgi:hypothetical protein
MSETLWDAPNQQVVRADGAPPWEEGEGGSAGDVVPSGPEEMTKAQLLEYAQQLGVSPANNAMSKEELLTAVQAHLAGGA